MINSRRKTRSAGAVLLGVDLEVGGKRMNAMVLAKPEVSERYEDAMDNGDLPVMVEDSGRGLYTVNLGNLQSGEEPAITVTYAQLLRLEQGQVRFSLPTTVAPRYGDPLAGGGLPVHATVDSSLEVSYPFTVQLDVFGVGWPDQWQTRQMYPSSLGFEYRY